jgi:cation transport ATPase
VANSRELERVFVIQVIRGRCGGVLVSAPGGPTLKQTTIEFMSKNKPDIFEERLGIRSARDRILLIWGVVLALLTFVCTLFFVPAFRPIFASFGSNLPWLTLFLLTYYPVIGALPLMTLAIRKLMRRGSCKVDALVGVLGSAMVWAFLLLALYVPIVCSVRVV